MKRHLQDQLILRLQQQPAVALLDPRQVGKTTLVRAVVASLPDARFLDLELESDRRQLT